MEHSSDRELLEAIWNAVESTESRLDKIEANLGIVPDLTCEISDFEKSIDNFKIFCQHQLKLSSRTIKMYAASITKFLYFSNGEVTLESVDVYLKSNDSQSWKNQEIKALRKYCRNFLNLGSWIEGFEIINIDKVNTKKMPGDLELAEFFHSLNGYSQIIFLLLHDTGLRLDEILQSKLSMFDFDTCSIDVREVHTGDSKSSYISFYQENTRTILKTYVKDNQNYFSEDRKMLPISARGVEIEFQRVSNDIGVQITPKDLRTVFVTKLSNAGIKDRFIDCLQGRIAKKVIAKHYTDYGLENLKKQYDKANLSLPL